MSRITDQDRLARFRPFLRVRLRQFSLDRRMRARFDESDILQDAYCRAIAGWENFHGETEAELYRWLETILKNTFVDKFREAHAQKNRSEVVLGRICDESSARLGDFLAADQTGPIELAQRQERLLALTEAIDLLPDEQKDAVVMHYLLGHTIKEIAVELGRAEGTVGYHLFLARRALKDRLGEE